VEIGAPRPGRAIDPYAVAPFASTFSGLTVMLHARGRHSPPELLDSGSNIYVTVAAPAAGGALIGGALGGQAALFRLRIASPP
jgi:hypothetical protein